MIGVQTLPDGRALYECQGCNNATIVPTAFREDAPEGVYMTLRRVTEYQNHYASDEIYTCSKECAIEVVKFGIHANSKPTTPIGKKTR